MNLSSTEVQELFRDSVQRFVQSEYDFDFRARRLKGQEDPDKLWRKFGELGWLGLGVSEADGGLGGGIVDQVIVQEEFGRGLVLEPFLGSLIFPVRILAHADHAVRHDTLPEIVAGRTRIAVAWAERGGRYDATDIAVRVERGSSGLTLSGTKLLVMAGGSAEQLIVSARTDDGVGLFLVSADAEGVSRKTFTGFDGIDYADIRFDHVRLGAPAMIIGPDRAAEVLEEALDHVRLGHCAALVGAMATAVAMTTDFIKMRKQFGRSLADFQVVQHRLVDMLIMTEQSRSALLGGLATVDLRADERKRAVSGCMVAVLEAVRNVTGLAVHQHGGIGFTRELAVGHFYRQSLVADKLFGDVEYHLDRFCDFEFGHAGAVDKRHSEQTTLPG